MKLKYLQHCFILCLMGFLFTGCQSFTGCSKDEVRCFKPHRSYLQQNHPQFNPDFNYVRVMFNGQVAWLAQGATDVTINAPEQVYYSADSNVFKWSQGRLSEIEHSAFSWREQNTSVLEWQNILQQPNTTFTRHLDLVDGAISIQEQRQIQPSVEPKYHAFVGDTSRLIWLREYTLNPVKHRQNFDSWYAFYAESVEPIYGQQCISTQYCITWQKWNTQHETVE